MDLLRKLLAFPGGSVVKNPPADAAVSILGCEDPLEEEMATHSSMLAWEKSMDMTIQSMKFSRPEYWSG